MKKLFCSLFLLAASCSLLATTENGPLQLKDLTNGKYYAKRISGVRPNSDGESYTQISSDRQRIVRYSFKDGSELNTIFDTSKARGTKLKGIDGYITSPDGQNLLIQTETSGIYRRSFTANYYIYNVRNNTLTPLSSKGPQQVPTFSPDGTMIAFVRQNNLFLVKLLFDNSESQITKDGKFNEVLNGIPDWVYEEEFTTNKSYCFTADSKMIVWIRYDESKVPVFSFPEYKGMNPGLSQYDTYPGAYSYKYPVAGETNSTVSVHSFDIKSHVTRTLQVPLDEDGYIPRLFPTDDANKVVVVTLNRHQDRMDIYGANPRSTICKLILREDGDRYLRESAYENLKFYGDHFVMTSDRSGYDQLYWYNINGRLEKQITKGDFEVTDFYGYNAQNGTFYYAAKEEGPLYKAVYATDLKGKTHKLSTQKGDNSAIFSGNFKYFMNVYSNASTPYITTLCNQNGKVIKTLIDNKSVKEEVDKANPNKKEFFQFKTSEGVLLNGWIIKPANFDASKKYPVIMYQYSGPGSQQVTDCWDIGFLGRGAIFEGYLAQEGFISVCVDGRGTGGRGSKFEKQTYLQLGLLEAKDQVETALYLTTLPYVDASNIAIWGWSFGGFNTLMSMSEGRKVFKAGIAVAAPSNWKYYDTVYTERYMRTPKENPNGYAINPINRVNDFSGNLLLIHGTADDNVHYRNAAEFSEAMVQADKQFEMQVYTNRNHSIYGGNTRHHLITRWLDFMKRNLQ